MKFLYGLAIAGAIIGSLLFVVGIASANGAPQEASAAAIGIGVAVLPYCLARAAHGISSIDARARFEQAQQTQIELLESIAGISTDSESETTEPDADASTSKD